MGKTEEQKKAYYKEWYAKNRDEILAKQKERSKKNYAENPEKYKEKSKKWREENRDRCKELQKAYSEKHREEIRARSAAWYQQNKEKARAQTRERKLKKYGITQAQYEEMARRQGFKCAICQCKMEIGGAEKEAYIDHDHKTGKVRGLLCMKCNSMLGMAEDNIDTLKNAIEYLSR